jgi:pimeloyl-ACP methyl ester carboxylesterase
VRNAVAKQLASRRIWVFIEGDGRAWQSDTQINDDPTPHHSTLLPLMATLQEPAVFIGRPCYFATHDVACEWPWWTLLRYSRTVVASMAAAIEHETQGFDEVILCGHSGGGTLATLIAKRMAKVTAVVTLAGNLQPQAWITYHGYSPLADTENPIDMISPARLREFHFAASEDSEILPVWITQYCAAQPQAHCTTANHTTHTEGWLQAWPQIYQTIGP